MVTPDVFKWGRREERVSELRGFNHESRARAGSSGSMKHLGTAAIL